MIAPDLGCRIDSYIKMKFGIKYFPIPPSPKMSMALIQFESNVQILNETMFTYFSKKFAQKFQDTKLFLPKPMRSPQVETEKLKPHCMGVIEVTS